MFRVRGTEKVTCCAFWSAIAYNLLQFGARLIAWAGPGRPPRQQLVPPGDPTRRAPTTAEPRHPPQPGIVAPPQATVGNADGPKVHSL